MAKKGAIQDAVVTFSLPGHYVDHLISQAVTSAVESAIEAHVKEAVTTRVTTLVDAISRDRIKNEIDRAMAEGWPTTNSYGERTGVVKTLKDRIGEVLNHQDRYSSNARWLDEHVKRSVDEAINKHFKQDIAAARESFKNQVDGVLSAVIKKAVADHLGVKVNG